MSKTIYRLWCTGCHHEHDTGRPAKRPPRGWKDVRRIRSLRDSRRLTPRPGERDFSLTDWETHHGLCPDCVKEGVEE